jgi:hypothetical protein
MANYLPVDFVSFLIRMGCFTKYGKLKSLNKPVLSLATPDEVVYDKHARNIPYLRVTFVFCGKCIRTRIYESSEAIPKLHPLQQVALFPVALVASVLAGIVCSFSDEKTDSATIVLAALGYCS